jgi:hypothetical protein
VLAVGTPAHVALDADGVIPDLTTLTLDELAMLVGITPSEHHT